MERTVECKVLQSQHPVTKAFTERRAKPTTKNFGVGSGAQEIKNNVGLTIVQRDNIWHPYYEVKLEEQDLGTQMRKNIEQKREKAVEGQAIEELQQKLNDMDQAAKDEAARKEAAASGTGEKKKKTFDLSAITAKAREREQAESEKKTEDMYAVKLTNVPCNCTEEEIRVVMGKFGRIESCYIPPTEQKRNKIAIVRFKFKEEASRAVEEQEVTIEFATVSIERALARQRRDDRGGGQDAKEAFASLKRRDH